MTRKILATSVVTAMVLALALALVGCGGSNTDTPVATGKSFYLDSAVSGINYKCGTQEGITDAEGAFAFDVGAGCTFYLGDIELRSVATNALKDGESLVETDVKIAQLLQTLDLDGDPSNGITISPEVVAVLATALNANGGDGTLPDTIEELTALSAELDSEVSDYAGHATTEADATEHLETTQASVLKAFFVGKTFYYINDDKNIEETVVFNSDATTLQFGTEAAVNITFGAHSIIDKDGEHFIDEITDSYVKGHDSHGEFIFYVTKAGDRVGYAGPPENPSGIQGTGPGNTPVKTEDAKASILGTWERGCIYDEYDNESRKTELTFKADESYTFKSIVYPTKYCTGDSTGEKVETGTYKLGKFTKGEDGKPAFEFDIHAVQEDKYFMVRFTSSELIFTDNKDDHSQPNEETPETRNNYFSETKEAFTKK
jgi:hypothetical protein